MKEKIKVHNLTRYFGHIRAVDNISMTVKQGEVLGFLGPNGAGKSTAMRMLSGFLIPTSGSAEICGFDVVNNPIEVKSRIGYMPEGAPSYGEMTPPDFLSFIADVRGLKGEDKRKKVEKAIERAALEDVLSQPIETLSKGYTRRVGLSQAILHDPEVLILDEPTEGLDPNQKHEVRSLIKQIASEKVIVISTHILEEVHAVCSRAVIIDRGKLVADGTPDKLIENSKKHNSVILKISDEKEASKIADILEKHKNIENIEKHADKKETVFNIFSKDSKPIITDIADVLKKEKISSEEMFVQQGSLDEVFRNLTTSDTAKKQKNEK